jgi:hypothetical protein
MTTMSLSGGMSDTSHHYKNDIQWLTYKLRCRLVEHIPVVLRHGMKIELQNCGALVKSSQNAYSFKYTKRVRAKQTRNLALI